MCVFSVLAPPTPRHFEYYKQKAFCLLTFVYTISLYLTFLISKWVNSWQNQNYKFQLYKQIFIFLTGFLHNCLSDFNRFPTYLMCCVKISLLFELDHSEFTYLMNFANLLEEQIWSNVQKSILTFGKAVGNTSLIDSRGDDMS